MMILLASLASLASLAATPGDVKVASTSFKAVAVTAELAEFCGETFATALGQEPGFEVATPRALSAILGLEREKELLGCSDGAASCLAELTGALGVQALVIGEVAKLDSSSQVNIRVIDPKTGTTMFALTRREKTSEALLDALGDAARETAQRLRARLGLAPSAPPPVRWAPWVLAGAGVVAASVGAVFLAQSSGAWAQLNGPPSDSLTPQAAQALVGPSTTQQALGLSLAGAGAAAIVGGLVWHFAGASAPKPTAWVTPDAAGFGLVLALP